MCIKKYGLRTSIQIHTTYHDNMPFVNHIKLGQTLIKLQIKTFNIENTVLLLMASGGHREKIWISFPNLLFFSITLALSGIMSKQ